MQKATLEHASMQMTKNKNFLGTDELERTILAKNRGTVILPLRFIHCRSCISLQNKLEKTFQMLVQKLVLSLRLRSYRAYKSVHVSS